jgi:inhibitor of cysteine peptidase
MQEDLMKSYIVFAILNILLLLVAVGCDQNTETTNATTVPALHGGEEAQVIDLALGDFSTENNIVKNIELVKPGSLIVKLGSNASTGYEWAEATITDTNIITQADRNFVAPKTDMVGAAGTDVWTFDSLKEGTATIKFSYGRPWEGGEKDTYTLTINITVK